MASYKVAKPDEYLAITGMGIKTIKICKSAWLFPFQRFMRFSVQPHDYAMNLQAMTKEKLQFLLPVVFTVGPDVNQRGANTRGANYDEPEHHNAAADPPGDPAEAEEADPQAREDKGDALVKYAMLLADSGDKKAKNPDFLENIVKGIIEGETRVLVSSMTMEEIFTERELFKRRIFRNIQSELSQFGLKIYNSNVKELRDAPNSKYFESLSQKAHEGAIAQSRIDVASAQSRGNIGEAQRKGEQEREIAKINAETAVKKTDRDKERATAEAVLTTTKTALNRDMEIARIEATRLTEAKDEELKREVEVKRAAAEMERLRALDVVQATIRRESKQQAADAAAYETQAKARADFEKAKQAAEAAAFEIQAKAKANLEKQKVDTDAAAYKTQEMARANLEKQKQDAEADRYKAKVDADAGAYGQRAAADAGAYATKQTAEAEKYAVVAEAEATLQMKLKEAEALAAMAGAYSKMSQAFGGPAGLLQYMMIEKGTYVQLAKANAQAIQGLQPKISVWNTGAEAGNGNALEGAGNQSSTATMRNIYQMLPPLMTTINEQTGITLPEWQFGKLATSQMAQMAQLEHGKAVNGVNGGDHSDAKTVASMDE